MAWELEGNTHSDAGSTAPNNYEEAHARAVNLYEKYMESFKDKRSALAEENKRLGQQYVENLAEKPTKSKSGLYYTVIEAGDQSKKATRADTVRVNYEGKLIDGNTFDKSRRPIEFPVAGVVAGFSEGVQLVGEGGKVRLFIPSNLGYGDNPPFGSGIQPGSMLVFDVEVVAVLKD